MDERKLETNKHTWDVVAPEFFGGTALPNWGVFNVEKDNKNLIGEIKGKTFVEVCCGSGHSIDYLIQNGAKKVYALDISHTQIEFAKDINKLAIQDGKVMLFEQAMESSIALPEPVDTVFSIYGIGWTIDLELTFKNVNSYLKIGGKFIWSWEHPMYPKVKYENGQIAVKKSYHDEGLRQAEFWGTEEGVHMSVRKISTWYNVLVKNGFEVVQILEPEPLDLKETHLNPARYYSVPRANLVPATIIFDCRKSS